MHRKLQTRSLITECIDTRSFTDTHQTKIASFYCIAKSPQSSFCFSPVSMLLISLKVLSKANGWLLFSKSWSSELPKAVNTAAPLQNKTIEGTNSASGQDPVWSRIQPHVMTPIIPGIAPHVLVIPNRMEASFGDRSAWLQ